MATQQCGSTQCNVSRGVVVVVFQGTLQNVEETKIHLFPVSADGLHGILTSRPLAASFFFI
jgi:hypothetical protein